MKKISFLLLLALLGALVACGFGVYATDGGAETAEGELPDLVELGREATQVATVKAARVLPVDPHIIARVAVGEAIQQHEVQHRIGPVPLGVHAYGPSAAFLKPARRRGATRDDNGQEHGAKGQRPAPGHPDECNAD